VSGERNVTLSEAKGEGTKFRPSQTVIKRQWRDIMRAILLAVPLLLAGQGAAAQTEEQLRQYFEGKRVLVKLEMPGTSQGVDVFPGTPQPIDFPRHAERLKRYGTAYRAGETALITKVKLKDDHIEFQLGGGGYGTFGDDTDTHVPVVIVPKSERERNLEKEVERTVDPVRKKQLREELDRLRRVRERENARNRTEAAQAQEIREANIRQRRIEGGSRFNIHYRPRVPPEALAPEAVEEALADYLDFGGPGSPPGGGAGDRELRKGLTAEQVDALLGRPDAISQRMEGTLSVSTSTYRTRDRRITAEFVEGVLIRFTITSP
jgi:hypothetical protein